MTRRPRILIIDGYTQAARDELRAGGASMAADLYVKMLQKCSPVTIECDVLFPSDDAAAILVADAIARYDGIAWTGCSLSLCDEDCPEVNAQVEMARAAFTVGVPGFGSCWAAQIAVVAAGGKVERNPKGREMGIARKISLTAAGRDHPMYDGKPAVFDSFTSHDDEVTELPAGATVLSGNSWTRVQSVSVNHENGEFWGLQYHPEYDLHELSRLTYCRKDKLVAQGFFEDRDAALRYVDRLEILFQNPERRDIAWELGIDADITNEAQRVVEVRNWIVKLVLPSMSEKEGKGAP